MSKDKPHHEAKKPKANKHAAKPTTHAAGAVSPLLSSSHVSFGQDSDRRTRPV